MVSSWEGRLGWYLFVGDVGKEAFINRLFSKSLKRKELKDCVVRDVINRHVYMALISLFWSSNSYTFESGITGPRAVVDRGDPRMDFPW